MTTSIRALALALSLLLVAPANAAAGVMLKIDAATQGRLGIVTAPLTAASRAITARGFARAIDVVPLATLDADIAAAASALAASAAEAARTRRLNAADQTVSKKAAETAAAQARADAAKLGLLRRRLGLEWGPSIQALSDARRGQLIADLAAGRATLVRIDSATGLSHLRGAATLDLGAGVVAHAAILGPARVGDPRLQSTGLLALVSGAEALRLGVGAVAPATISEGAATRGVMIPRAALLRTAGQTFAYVRRDAGSFERRPVTGGLSDPAGLFASGGFRPGEQVVVRGAAQLFAAETPAHGAE
ncbi:hypothetical protein [Phenylobacterium sp.]|uniref:hypothetical protein n=1 Tax=Phenylobacterium sp. TaxID=1871053 RepID=UPI0025E8A206|nr:hypothetical protein [Phenylobacterium sp.]